MGFLDKLLTALQDAGIEDQREDIERALAIVVDEAIEDRTMPARDMFDLYKKTRLAQLKAKREGK